MCSASWATTAAATTVKKSWHEGGREPGGEADQRDRHGAPAAWTVPDSMVAGRVITVDALLTQRALASHLLQRRAHYLFTVKGNRKNLMEDIQLLMAEAMAETSPGLRPEKRKARTRPPRAEIGLDIHRDQQLRPVPRRRAGLRHPPGRHRGETGKKRTGTAFGVTSLSPEAASPERVLQLNRGHWRIEATHHVLDWSFDEDRSRIRTGHGPANTTLLRRFAIGLVRQRGQAVAETVRAMARKPRRVPGILRMTGNTRPRPAAA